MRKGRGRGFSIRSRMSSSPSIHRFFIPPEWVDGERVTIRDSLVHQIRNVLRLGRGDIICVLNNSGWEHEVEIDEVSREQVIGAVKSKSLSRGEPGMRLIIYQGMLKGDKFELVLQKGTELGVAGFAPVLCQHSVAAVNNTSRSKFGRWQRVIREAAEQSRRGRLPLLFPPQPFEEACREASGFSLLAWEGEEKRGLRAALLDLLAKSQEQGAALKSRASPKPEQDHPQVNLFVGPEGGFAEHEVEFARSQGITPVSLGQRLLRAETASIAAAATILYEWGELG